MTLLRRQAISATFFADAETLYNDPYFAPFFRQAVLEGHEMGLLSKGTYLLKTCFLTFHHDRLSTSHRSVAGFDGQC
jgi:hypothetical protein